jgi:oligopeptide/dipeptide ABC transporter ATP-binding protein
VGRTIIRLLDATEGKAIFEGENIFALKSSALRTLRRRVAMIFQDPFSSLNPRMTVGEIIAEPLKVHRLNSRRDRRRRVGELLERVGLSAEYLRRYPHEFSGGQRQRIGIARALACQPELIICDEPVSALDVSIQAQILNLLSDLQSEMGLSYLFIAHNLAVVEHFADSVAVMYLGRIVEQASRDDLYLNPRHPYTESLFSSVPRLDPEDRPNRIRLTGEVPSPINPPAGCPFHPRCPYTRERAKELSSSETVNILSAGRPTRIVRRCMEQVPTLQPDRENPKHFHACLLRR